MNPTFETAMPHMPNHDHDAQQALVSAWLDDALDAQQHAQQCEQLCELLGETQSTGRRVSGAVTAHAIGQALRAQPVPDVAQQTARTSRVLAAVQAQYAANPTAQTHANAAAQVQISTKRAANDAWFNWRAMSSAAAVALALGVWWQFPAETGDVASQQFASAPTRPAVDLSVIKLAASDAGDIGASVITDPNLEALLAAHRQTGISNAWPGAVGFVRNVAWTGGTQ